MKKTGMILGFLIVSLSLAMGQLPASDTDSIEPFRDFQGKRLKNSLNIGSEFSSVAGFGSALTTWVSPGISYGITPRIRLGGGFTVATTNYFGARPWFGTEENNVSNGNFTTATLYVNGLWAVNDRLTIFGSAFKQIPITKDPLPYNPFNRTSQKGAQGVDFNIGYKIGDNFYFQAGFRYSEGINPWYRNSIFNDPFNTNPALSPFGNSSPRW